MQDRVNGIARAARSGGDGMAPSSPDPRDALVGALLTEAQRAESAGQREVARRRYESALYLIATPERARDASRILRRVG